MTGDAQATKKRLLDAATREFATYGIAGARVDRIAASAGSNKAQIYHYFQSKDGLFDAVFNAIVANTVRDVPIDATDLPGYAGRLFDSYEAHPEVTRLATWHRLERADSQAPLESILASNRHKIDEIARAQRDGLLPTRYAPVDLLALIVHLAALWTATTPEYATLVVTHSRAHRRTIVTDAVAALLKP
ncbi:TetR family transcriptional regulator [Micromonospora sp. NPDC050417]|uniref:TetR family transcriptional regulator n=1 Tax=Micromonospora sp. NPDC050417 TaxID=3364280 RepID=UPI0037A9AC44